METLTDKVKAVLREAAKMEAKETINLAFSKIDRETFKKKLSEISAWKKRKLYEHAEAEALNELQQRNISVERKEKVYCECQKLYEGNCWPCQHERLKDDYWLADIY